jgi:hypothetical protein
VINGKWKILRDVLIIGSLAFMLASPAHGTMTYPVTLTVQSGSETVSEVFTQSIDTQVEVLSGSGSCIATILQLNNTVDQDPAVNLRFSVVAGSTDTTFTFSSPVVNFDAISGPSAVTSSSLTLTDSDGDGATLTGLESGGTAYKAIYNGGTVWATLNPSYSFATPYDSQAESNRDPLGGMGTIPDTLTSIQSEYSFTLSANDQASGTSMFSVNSQVVPEPLTFAAVLTGLAGLGGYVRNRTKRQRMAN